MSKEYSKEKRPPLAPLKLTRKLNEVFDRGILAPGDLGSIQSLKDFYREQPRWFVRHGLRKRLYAEKNLFEFQPKHIKDLLTKPKKKQ